MTTPLGPRGTYVTYTTMGDFGPWVSKLVLELPCAVSANDVSPRTFDVYCERHEVTGEVLMHQEPGEPYPSPSTGNVEVLDAYPSDPGGARLAEGAHVTLELAERRLLKTIEGTVMHSRRLDVRFRVTQLAELPAGSPLARGGRPDDGPELPPDGPASCEVPEAARRFPVRGLVLEERTGDLCPEAAGWQTGAMAAEVEGIRLGYAYFEPAFAPAPPALGPFAEPVEKPERAPLVVWLHGAGEGGGDPWRAFAGNRVTALSQPAIQDYFGGDAWVLVPQCPTFWMDDGEAPISRSMRSLYVRPLRALVDEFVAAHASRIDTSRIVIGGLSNGGFMTVRMCLDYPELFCAALPVCAPFFREAQTPEAVARLAQTPMWFVHSRGDELVDPRATSLPLYAALKAAGDEVHYTYFDHVEDLTGRYRNPDGTPRRAINHSVWIHAYNDLCRTDLDGTNVLVDGEPVGMWAWAARQRKEARA